ncbi:MAG: patatin-like phospholipase family protein, partial [Acetobacteraceae bacterium]|nr:patatin-like phospholipase family protein [Acetobacteraceae bacterium]
MAVVIGSGSVKCAAALGLINVLQRERIDIDMLVGCSAGCLYATLIASGRSVPDAMDMTRRLRTSEITARRDRRSMLRALLPGMLGFDAAFGLRDDTLIMQRLRSAFGDERIENMRIPLHLAATDFANGN